MRQEQSRERLIQKNRLLRTKLYAPHAHPDLVPRARLLEQLDQSQSCKLTLISAPAGFGKTTALSDWIDRRGVKVAWVSLDGNDNDPIRFWSYVTAALSSTYDGLGEAAYALLQSPQVPPTNAVMAELVNEVEVSQDSVILVLDDYHVIEDAAIHESLAYLVDNMPPQLHLIIASRSDPPLSLASLRARRQLVELRPRELRFTKEEAAVFLNRVMDLKLSATDIDVLEERTEGWVAGLQLAALSIQMEDDVAGFVRTFTGSHRFVFDYLAQEVLRRQPEPVRTFLLKVSILRQLCGSLCDSVTGMTDGSALLEQLERSNLFVVPLDQVRHWYRFHHLFSDFLRFQAEKELGKETATDLNRRASAWLAQNGFTEEAVGHAFAAADYQGAASLIEQHAGEMFLHNELNILVAWSRMLPIDLLKSHPKLSAAFAWAQIATGNWEDAEQSVQAIEAAVGGTPELLVAEGADNLAPEVRAALAEVSVMRSTLIGVAGDPLRMLEFSRQALPYLTDDAQTYLYNTQSQLRPGALFNMAMALEVTGEVSTATETFAQAATLSYEQHNLHIFPMALGHLAKLQTVRGELRLAAETYRRAIQLSKEFTGQLSPLAGLAYVGLGNLLYERNDLVAALENLEDGIALSKKWMNWDALVPGYVGIARVRRGMGNWAGAFAALEEARGMCQSAELAMSLPQLDAARAKLSLERGDLESAARWAETCGLEVDGEPSYFREGDSILFARFLLAQGRTSEALQLLDRLLAAAQAGQRIGRVIEILTVQALAHQAEERIPPALTALESAVTLAEAEEFVRVFLDEGEAMESLLGAVEVDDKAASYVDRLLSAFRAENEALPQLDMRQGLHPSVSQSADVSASSAHARHFGDALSERELEVLGLIAAGLTNEQIASTLVVSVNTIKTHLKSIYGKLQVRSRTQAIAAARELNLLS